MSPAQTITTEWTEEKCLDKRKMRTSAQYKVSNRINTDGRKRRQGLAAQVAKSSLSRNGNNVFVKNFICK